MSILQNATQINSPASDKDALYWQLRQENEAFLRTQQWRQRHYDAVKSARQRLALEAERLTANWVTGLGYLVSLTTHKCPFDLWVADQAGRAVRLEVKISQFYPHKRGGRYQAELRRRQAADLVVFIARNGRDWPFIIPVEAIRPRRHITITSYCPADYQGQWAEYLHAWDRLHQAIARAEPQPFQPTLFNSGGTV